MISNEDSSTDGKSSHHNTGSKGSVCTVRVGSRSLPLYPLVSVCLGLLNTILILTAIAIGIYCGNVSEVSAPHQINGQVLFTEMEQLQTMQTEVFKAEEEIEQALKQEFRNHEQLKRELEQSKTLSDNLQRLLETLQVEKATLQSSITDIQESCGRCLPGWFLLNTTCYYYSKSGSNPPKNWADSRADCISRGADLTVIDNWEEQLNLYDHLPKVPTSIRSRWSRAGGIWIGLTDMHSEGSWVWLNNVPQDGGYWITGQHNSNAGEGGHGKDCAALLNMRNPRQTWFDANCLDEKDWLCEMEPN